MFLKIIFLFLLQKTVLGQEPRWQQYQLPPPSEAYSEGECINSPQVVSVDVNWILQSRLFYVPLASQFFYHRFSETLLSRPPASDTELSTMCLTIEATSSGPGILNLTNVGYDDREFRQTCAPGGGGEPGKINCRAVGSGSGVNPTKTFLTETSMVSWDGRTYMIIVRCVDGFYRDFAVLSTRPSVSRDVLNSVLNVTRHLGFDQRRIQVFSYDNCLRGGHALGGGVGVVGRQQGTPLFTNSILTAPFPATGFVQGDNKVVVVKQQQQREQQHVVPIDHHGHIQGGYHHLQQQQGNQGGVVHQQQGHFGPPFGGGFPPHFGGGGGGDGHPPPEFI